jgi:hypothetical protein
VDHGRHYATHAYPSPRTAVVVVGSSARPPVARCSTHSAKAVVHPLAILGTVSLVTDYILINTRPYFVLIYLEYGVYARVLDRIDRGRAAAMVQQQRAALLLQLAAAASCWTSAAASAVATSPGPPLPPLTKCCQWSTLEPGGSQKKCLGDGQHDGACPVGVGCECIAGWTPPSWAEEIASADRSLAGAADEPGATIGNGYVGAFVPRGVPGSAGPPYVGVEHVKGVFAAGAPLSQGHSSGTLGPNRQVSLASLASWTATAFVAELGSKPAVSTASTLDWRRAAYEVATPLPADDSSSYGGGGDRSHCVQSTYAHRQQPHLLITEFVCTNHNADASAAPLPVTIKQVIETPFVFSSLVKNNILPRQARDKRKLIKRDGVSRSVAGAQKRIFRRISTTSQSTTSSAPS